MSKKKRRYVKKCRKAVRKATVRSGKDTHHLCFQRRHWRVPELYQLRTYWYCQIEIPKEPLHQAIHEFVGDVPAPKPVNAKGALEQLRLLGQQGAIHETDPIEKRLELLAGLFDCVEQPTADAFRQQLEIVHRFKKAPE